MSRNPVINALTLPFRLPGLIADKVTPKTDILATSETLGRRSKWGYSGSVFFGCAAVLGFAGAGLVLAGTAVAGTIGATAALASLGIFGGAYAMATASAVCNKIYIDATVITVLNAAVKEMQSRAVLEETSSQTPDARTPEFNHAAATTLDKDIKAMAAIKLAPNRGVSP